MGRRDAYYRHIGARLVTLSPIKYMCICLISLKILHMQATEANVQQIVLHSNVDSINAISVLTTSGLPVALNPLEPFVVEPQYHFLKINLQQSLVPQTNYTLIIEYSNTMNEGPMKRGIWKGWYTDDNGDER